MPTRRAEAEWKGGLKNGSGTFSGESGAIKGSYSFGTRFAEEPGTNPEELLAAAEAACTIEKTDGGFTITTMQLRVRAVVPGIDAAKFNELAEATKTGCPVSKAFAGNLKFELDAELV